MSRWLSRRAFNFCGAATSLIYCRSATALPPFKRPELFFYPAPCRLADNSIMSSPVTIEKTQIAEDFPQITEMSGVVLVLYWSKVMPRGKPDFSIIDHALDFWSPKGKKVVLDVATVGHPMFELDHGEEVFVTPTPDYILARIQTFAMAAPPIAPVRPVRTWEKRGTIFPVYWDKTFIEAVAHLVGLLAHYDGHPGLSKVRISTGILGEDNPTFDGLRSNMPGFSNAAWLQYCRTITDIYLRAFSHTQLEFDIDRIGWIYSRGTPDDRTHADQFVDYLRKRQVFLAMDGLDSVTVSMWRGDQSDGLGPARCLDYLTLRRATGDAVGLEGSPLFNPRFQDISSIASAIRDVPADRLVLFGDLPGVLSFHRQGPTRQNETTRAVFPITELDKLYEQGSSLLELIGYKSE